MIPIAIRQYTALKNGYVSVNDTLEGEGGDIEVAYLLDLSAVLHMLLVDLYYYASVGNAVELVCIGV